MNNPPILEIKELKVSIDTNEPINVISESLKKLAKFSIAGLTIIVSPSQDGSSIKIFITPT